MVNLLFLAVSSVVASDDLEFFVDVLSSYVSVLLPVGITLFGVLYSVRLVSDIIKNFSAPGISDSDDFMYDSDGLMLGEWEDYYNEDGSRKF